MIEVRLHGRGGQGAVTAAELVAQGVIEESRYAQGFPNFGAERRGAPVTAYLRASDEAICLREKIDRPDVVLVLDASLMSTVDVSEGLKSGGTLIINSPGLDPKELERLSSKYHVAIVDGNRIAMETLGVPIVNTAMIGALIRATEILRLESLEEPFRHRFGRLAEKNLTALRRANDETRLTPGPERAAQQGQIRVEPGGEASHVLKIDALHPWTEVEYGCDIVEPGSSAQFHTGNWRTTGKPVTDFEECIKCGLCWVMCPDMSYSENEEGYFELDERYCKGCGICAEECPKNAIEMKEEQQ